MVIRKQSKWFQTSWTVFLRHSWIITPKCRDMSGLRYKSIVAILVAIRGAAATSFARMIDADKSRLCFWNEVIQIPKKYIFQTCYFLFYQTLWSENSIYKLLELFMNKGLSAHDFFVPHTQVNTIVLNPTSKFFWKFLMIFLVANKIYEINTKAFFTSNEIKMTKWTNSSSCCC